MTPTTVTTYDNDGDVLSVQDPDGNLTADSYDAADRLTKSVAPNPVNGTATGPTTGDAYDPAGNLYSVEDPDGDYTYYGYDALGRQTIEKEPKPGNAGEFLTSATTYDGDDRVLSVQDPEQNTTRYDYNALGQMVKTTQPAVPAAGGGYRVPVTSYQYDTLDEVLKTTDPMERTTSDTYNVGGEQLAVSESNTVTSSTYDTLGNESTITDPDGNQTISLYDGFGRLAETIQPDPNGGTITPKTFYGYDANGQLVEQISPAGPASAPNSVQQVTAWQYDDLGRTTAVSQLDGTITSSLTQDAYGVWHLVYSGTTELTTAYGYDADGNQMTVTDPLGNVTTYHYDHDNRLVEEILPNPSGGTSPGPTTQYTYDAEGNRLTETDPDGNVTCYAYNSLDQLTSETGPVALCLSGSTPVTAAAVTSYQYDADGNLTQETDPDGRVTVFSYDALNRETGEQWYASASAAAGGPSAASDVLTFSYDADGELVSAADKYSAYTFAYDSLGRQTSVDNEGSGPSGTSGTPGVPDVVLTSTYDAAGNRTSLSAAVGGTADFVNRYCYDDLNRETQVTQGASAAAGHDGVDSKLVTFTYNADGQLASIDRFHDLSGASGDRVATSSYGYDDFGRLTGLTHTAADGATTFAAYAWGYDDDGKVTSFANSANLADYSAEDAGYVYDHDGQLTAASPLSGRGPG